MIKLRRAISYYKKALDIYSGHSESLFALFCINHKGGKLLEPNKEEFENICHYSTLLQRTAYLNLLIKYLLDYCHVDSSQFDVTAQYFLSLYPENEQRKKAIKIIFSTLQERGYFSLAEKYCAMAITLDEKNEELYLRLLENKMHCKNSDEMALVKSPNIRTTNEYKKIQQLAVEHANLAIIDLLRKVTIAQYDNIEKGFAKQIVDERLDIKNAEKLFKEFLSRNKKAFNALRCFEKYEIYSLINRYFEKIDTVERQLASLHTIPYKKIYFDFFDSLDSLNVRTPNAISIEKLFEALEYFDYNYLNESIKCYENNLSQAGCVKALFEKLLFVLSKIINNEDYHSNDIFEGVYSVPYKFSSNNLLKEARICNSLYFKGMPKYVKLKNGMIIALNQYLTHKNFTSYIDQKIERIHEEEYSRDRFVQYRLSGALPGDQVGHIAGGLNDYLRCVEFDPNSMKDNKSLAKKYFGFELNERNGILGPGTLPILMNQLIKLKDRIKRASKTAQKANLQPSKSLFNDLLIKEKAGRDFVIANNEVYKYLGKSKTIIIPEGIVSISEYFSDGHNNGSTVVFPKSIINIGNFSVQSKYIKSIFLGADKNGFVINNGVLVAYLGKEKNIVVPSNVVKINDAVFYDTATVKILSINEVEVENLAKNWAKLIFDHKNSDFVIDRNGELLAYLGSGAEVIVPHGVKKINNLVFQGRTDIEKITLPNTVIEIENCAFQSCWFSGAGEKCHGLKYVFIPDTVKTISYRVFENCFGLTHGGIVSISIKTKIINGDQVCDNFYCAKGSTLYSIFPQWRQ